MQKSKRSREDWLRLVGEYQSSGLSVNEFSRRNGVGPWTLRDWLKRSKVETVSFVEVGSEKQAAEYRVVLRGGRELRISGAFNEAVLQNLIGLLERC
jgi:transposase-like protein